MTIDTEFTDLPVCPYCGDTDECWYESEICQDGDYETFECNKCEKEYEVHLSVSHSFTTFTMEDVKTHEKEMEELKREAKGWRSVNGEHVEACSCEKGLKKQ